MKRQRLLAILLRCYPAWHRQRCDEEMLAFWGAQLEESRYRGWAGRVRFLLEAGRDALWWGMVLRLRGRQARASRPEGRSSAHPSSGLRRFRRFVENTAADVRYAGRRLQRAPAFATAIVLCLGLGFGATAGVFSFFFGIVLRPLPFAHPERVVVLFETGKGVTRASPTFTDIEGWRDRATTLSAIGAYTSTRHAFEGTDGAEVLTGTKVSYNLFPLLGIRPARGRTFTLEDEGPGAAPTILLGHGLWLRRFGGRADILGRSVALDGKPYTVIGVMPPRFAFPERADFWVPLRTSADPRAGYLSAGVARLRDGISLAVARADVARVAALMREAYPQADAGRDIAVRPLKEDFLWGLRLPAAMLLLVAAIVLLLAAANVANLLLARGATRRWEIAVRRALGAERSRIVRQLLTESLLLAIGGGVLGVALGVVARNLYLALLPEGYPYYLRFDVDLPVLMILATVTLVVGVLFGLASALASTHVGAAWALRGGGGTVTAGRGDRLRSVLLGLEAGLALVVLIAAGTATQSLRELRHVAPGFVPDRLLTLQVALPAPLRQAPARQRAVFARIRDRVAALPGVTGAAVVSSLPIDGAAAGTAVSAEGTPPPPRGQEPWVVNKTAQPGYFATMGIDLVAGREFRPGDGAPGTAPVAIINETFARRYWPGQNPLGMHIRYGGRDSDYPWMEVVGVSRDVRQFGLDRPVELGIYEPFQQSPYWREFLVIRTARQPLDLVPAIRAAIRSVAATAPVYDIRPMSRVLYDVHWRPIVLTRLLSVFAGLALLLAVLGVYGVVSFYAAQRRREFGIRLVLGARSATLVREAVRQTVLPLGVGLAGGMAGGFVAIRLAASHLFGIQGLSPAVTLLALLLLAATAGSAAFVPAWRTSRLDPVRTLTVD